MTPVPEGTANTSTSAENKQSNSKKFEVSVIDIDTPAVWRENETARIHSNIPKFYQCNDEALGRYYLNSAPSSESDYSGELERKATLKNPIKNLCHGVKNFYNGQSTARRILGSVFVPLVVLIIVFVIIMVTKEGHIIEYTHVSTDQ